MKLSRIAGLGLCAALLFGVAACRDDTTTAPGAIANVSFDAPASVHSGESVQVDVRAVNAGINNVQNGRVDVTLPAPLHVDSVEASEGTSAMFSNGAGATVTWTLGSLDSNSQSRLHVHLTGTLPAASAAMSLTLRASLTADGVHAGDAVAEHTLQLMP